jgi:hypothetical protein
MTQSAAMWTAVSRFTAAALMFLLLPLPGDHAEAQTETIKLTERMIRQCEHWSLAASSSWAARSFGCLSSADTT